MGGRKHRLGRIPRYMEVKRQAAKVNKPGRPKKLHRKKVIACIDLEFFCQCIL